MGCCFSLKMSSGLQGERSGLLQSPHHDGLSEVTEELRQHAAAVAQHVCLEEEGEGDSGGARDETTEVLLSPDTFCHLYAAKPDRSNIHRNVDGETSATRGVGPALGSDPRVELNTGRVKNAPDGSQWVWSTPSGLPSADSVVTEASADRRGPKVDSTPQHRDKAGEEVCVAKMYQGFKTKTQSFYSICSIDTDDLEQEQSQSPTAGGTAALLHAAGSCEVKDALKQTSRMPSAEQKEQSGPWLLDLSSDPLIPASSLWNIEEPSWDSPHDGFNDEPPEEPSMTSHAAQGTCERGSEGLPAQQEKDLEQNLDSGFIDDHLHESEPSAVQQTGSFLTATQSPEPFSQSSPSLTFSPPHLNQSLPSPSEISPSAPQGELASEEVVVSLTMVPSWPPSHQPTPTLYFDVETLSGKLHKSANFNDPVKSSGQELDPESTESEFGSVDDAAELLQLPDEPQTVQEASACVSCDGPDDQRRLGPSPLCFHPSSSLCASAGEDEAERASRPSQLPPENRRQQQPQTSDVSPEVTEPQNDAAEPSHPLGDPSRLNSGEDSEESPPALHPSNIPAETFPDQTSSVFDSTSAGCQAELSLACDDPGQVDAHASTPSYMIHSICPEQHVAAEGGGSSGGRMREMVSELLGDDADLPICRCAPEPWIKLGLEESRRAWAWAQGTSQAEFPQTGGEAEEIPALVSELQPSMALLGVYPYSTVMPQGACVWDWHTDCSQPGSASDLLPHGPVACPSLNPDAHVWNNPDFGVDICSFADQEPQQLWTRFSNNLTGYEGARLDSNAFPRLSSCEVTIRPVVDL